MIGEHLFLWDCRDLKERVMTLRHLVQFEGKLLLELDTCEGKWACRVKAFPC